MFRVLDRCGFRRSRPALPAVHEATRARENRKRSIGPRAWQGGAFAWVGGIALGLAASTSAAGDGPLAWPVPVDPPAITGTFGEPRTRGFHAGLDIRTEGRTGLPVRTPVDGDVVRLRTSPDGYGKAVYLRDEAGRTWVFAHLLAFADRLQRRVVAAQAKSKRYAQDLAFEAGVLPFRAGDVLALSGDTGTGAPHLHLEVRDGAGRPTNPALLLDPPDREPPRVLALRAGPGSIGARVEGAPWASVLAPGDTLHALGAITLEVQVEDHTGYAPFRVSPLGLELFVDGELRYQRRQEVFDYSDQWQIVYEVQRDEEGRRWTQLHRDEGNRLEGRRGDGRLRVEEGTTHEVVVRAFDHRGQSGEARWWIVGGGAPILCHDPIRAGRFELVLSAAADLDPARPVGQLFPADPKLRTIDLRVTRQGDRAIPLAEIVPGRFWHQSAGNLWLVPGGTDSFSLSLGDAMRLEDPDGGALLDGGLLVIRKLGALDGEPPGSIVTRGLEVRADALRFRRALRLHREGADAADLVLMRRDRRGRWRRAGDTEVDTTGAWAPLDGDGAYVWVRDLRPPRIGSLIVEGVRRDGDIALHSRRRVEHGITRPRWPALQIEVRDDVSGIDPADVVLRIDGDVYPARPELEDDRVWVEWDVDPGPGAHELTLEVRDRAGHSQAAAWRLRLESGN